MTRHYRIQEGSFTLPEIFNDRTVNIFVPEGNERASPSLNISRDTLKPGEDLTTYIDRQVALMKKNLSQHQVLSRTPAQAGTGRDALVGEQIATSHKAGKTVAYQHQAGFITDSGRVLVFTLTSPQPFDDKTSQMWNDWLSGFQPDKN
ncbi:DcrB-related protein [Enterobacter sp.]|uniref:DcrB-related protein n=1 Tax=Enterobacter sp. TaxID=42895 RepID=UPI00296EEF0D|nr:DcrB-related protein [Enterobacter sp.]